MANLEFGGDISAYQYIGDDVAFGSLQLTMLARSFSEIAVTPLSDYFPDVNYAERTLVVEQIIDTLAIMPIVKFGVPNSGFIEPYRVRQFTASPIAIREDDFLEMHLINQLRAVGTFNTAANPVDIISLRVQRLVDRHRRTKDVFQHRMLLGGISYTDPRSKMGVNVSANIPAQNFFTYSGWNATVVSGATINLGGFGYAANQALANDKGRPEASFFVSTDGRIGVPWSDPRADIIRCLHLLKKYLWNTNKNKFTELVISDDLLTVIMSVNEQLKTYMGQSGVTVLNNPTSSVAGNAAISGPVSVSNPINVTFTTDGYIATIAGLKVRAVSGIYKDPQTQQDVTYWPANKIVLVAPKAQDGPETLGFTYHCSGEAEDGTPGVYMRVSSIPEPPAVPGRYMQLGDALLPVPIYPHWISVITVADPNIVNGTYILQSDLGYGTF